MKILRDFIRMSFVLLLFGLFTCHNQEPDKLLTFLSVLEEEIGEGSVLDSIKSKEDYELMQMHAVFKSYFDEALIRCECSDDMKKEFFISREEYQYISEEFVAFVALRKYLDGEKKINVRVIKEDLITELQNRYPPND